MSEPTRGPDRVSRLRSLLAAAAVGAIGTAVFVGPILPIAADVAHRTPALNSIPIAVLFLTPIGLLAGYVASGVSGFAALWLGAVAGTLTVVVPASQIGGFASLAALLILMVIPQAVLPGYLVARLAVGFLPAGRSAGRPRRLAVYVLPAALAWGAIGVVGLTSGISERSARQPSCPVAAARPDLAGRMIFVGSHALCSVDVRSGSVRLVHASPVEVEEVLASPRLSPDAGTIAFVRARLPPPGTRGQQTTEAVLIGADGSNPRTLRAPPDVITIEALDWAGDGKRLAVTAGGPGCSACAALYVVDVAAETWSRVALDADVVNVRYPVWAPRAETILVGITTPEQWRPPMVSLVSVVRLDGSVAALVAADGDQLSRADWSPDGSRVAVARNLGRGSADLFITRSDGSIPARLTTMSESSLDGGYSTNRPVWSPDGGSLAVAYYASNALPDAIWILPVTGGKPVLLIQSGTDPDWVP